MQEPQISDAHLASLVSRYLTSNGFYKAAAAFKEDAKHLFAAPNPRLANESLRNIVCEYFRLSAVQSMEKEQEKKQREEKANAAERMLKSIQTQIHEFLNCEQKEIENEKDSEDIGQREGKKRKLDDYRSPGSGKSQNYIDIASPDLENEDEVENEIENENPLSMLWNNEDFCEKMASLINSHIDPSHIEELKPSEITFEPILNEISQDGDILHALDSALGRIINERQSLIIASREGFSISSFSKKRKISEMDENLSLNLSECGLDVGDGYSNPQISDAEPENGASERSFSANFAPINFSNEGNATPQELELASPIEAKQTSNDVPQVVEEQQSNKKVAKIPQKKLLEQAKMKAQSADFDLDKFLDSLHK